MLLPSGHGPILGHVECAALFISSGRGPGARLCNERGHFLSSLLRKQLHTALAYGFLIMEMYYWKRPDINNFGDMINPWLWPRILPDSFWNAPSSLFVGIGTVINDRLPRASNTVVLGAGAGYGELPAIDGSWHFYGVRGPGTRELLSLPATMTLGDPAILAPDFHAKEPGPLIDPGKGAFMPHWTTRTVPWEKICTPLDLDVIDPFEPVPDVLDRIRSCSFVVAEAMHGAIVADAFRIPWIPVQSGSSDFLPFKWKDWGESMSLEVEPHRIIRPRRPATSNSRLDKFILKRGLEWVQGNIAQRRLADITTQVERLLSGDDILERRKSGLYQAIDRMAREWQ